MKLVKRCVCFIIILNIICISFSFATDSEAVGVSNTNQSFLESLKEIEINWEECIEVEQRNNC